MTGHLLSPLRNLNPPGSGMFIVKKNVADALNSIQRKPAAAGLRLDHKPLALDWKLKIGQAIERALVLAHLSKQEASQRMGYPPGDQSAISRWIAGADRPLLDKLFAIDELRPWIPVALAEIAGAEVQTTVTVRRMS